MGSIRIHIIFIINGIGFVNPCSTLTFMLLFRWVWDRNVNAKKPTSSFEQDATGSN